MKKLITMILLSMIAMTGFSQLTVKQIAFGARGVDSISGATTKYYYFNQIGARGVDSISGATTKYYYFNQIGVRNGLTKATTLMVVYEITYTYVMIYHPLVYTASDSVQLSWEVSLDNVTWFKWTNADELGYYYKKPIVTGSNVFYRPSMDLVTTTSTDAGALWRFNNCAVPYFRLKCVRYVAASASYVQAWVVIKRL